jgi:2-(1,2-epoxy-1,2-dihydrophenyl)acetyl-CoA isomerase
MAYETIELSVADGIARLTLNRPDAANGIDLALANDLRDATFAINRDPSVRVVLLAGNGPRFCGGGDVKGFANVSDLPTELRRILAGLHAALSQLVRGDALVVAAVQGSAAGAGMGLVGAADYVVSAESTRYVMAYTGIGLTPDGASSWFLPRTIGLKRAIELTVTNRVLSAQEALDWGLITEVVADDELTARAEAVAAQLAAGPTRAHAAAKRLLHTSLEETLETHLAAEAEAIADAAATADGQEGIAAFLEKRKPAFTGE